MLPLNTSLQTQSDVSTKESLPRCLISFGEACMIDVPTTHFRFVNINERLSVLEKNVCSGGVFTWMSRLCRRIVAHAARSEIAKVANVEKTGRERDSI